MRQPSVTITVGRQGVGKTYSLCELIPKLSESKGVLIFDVSNEEKFSNYKNILFDDLPKWKSKGIYKFYHTEPDEVFDMVLKNVRNCFLLLEDSRSYLGSKLTKTQKAVFGIRRQLGIDIFANFWTLTEVPRDVFTASNYIRIFKTRDNIENLESLDKMPNPDDIIKAWKEVQKNPNPYYSITVKTNC